MNLWTHCCFCVFVCVCVWSSLVVRFTCLQKVERSIFKVLEAEEPLRIAICTSNSAEDVSLEEEHVDDCEMSECMTLRLCPHVFLLD